MVRKHNNQPNLRLVQKLQMDGCLQKHKYARKSSFDSSVPIFTGIFDT